MYISGSHIAWGNATPAIKNQEWYVNVPPNEQLIVFISWYIGAIIGSVILFFVNEKLTRKTLYVRIWHRNASQINILIQFHCRLHVASCFR